MPRVSPYNFSDALMGGKTVVPFTTDRQAIYEACVSTTVAALLRPRDLDELRLSVPRATPDLLLITDMQLTNLEDVITYLAGIEGRITVIHIGENTATGRFRLPPNTIRACRSLP